MLDAPEDLRVYMNFSTQAVNIASPCDSVKFHACDPENPLEFPELLALDLESIKSDFIINHLHVLTRDIGNNVITLHLACIHACDPENPSELSCLLLILRVQCDFIINHLHVLTRNIGSNVITLHVF